jgi:hypothetical protein
MAITAGNRTTQAFGVEPSVNTEPSSTPATFYLAPTSFGAWGPKPERVFSNPIGPNIMAEAGTRIRTMAPCGFNGELNRDHFRAFLAGALRSTWSTPPRRFYPTEVRSTDYVVAANGALTQNTLIIARGFTTAANNGLKVVGAASDGTHIVTSGLTAETVTAANGPTVEVCGWQGASGDLQIDADDNLISSSLDFTTLGLTVGQTIWIGGDASGVKFATATHRGQARVTVIAANKLTLDNKTTGTFPAAAADNGSGKTIQVFFGQFIKAVPTTDASYAEPTYHLEYGHAKLSAGSAAYQYITGAAVATWALSMPTAALATIAVGFDGRATVDPTATRRTSFTAPLRQNAKAPVNTAEHIRRGRIRQTATDLTGYITGVDLSVATNLQRNEAHGQQDSVETTFGDLDVTGQVQAFFSSMDLIPALQSDTTCNADWLVRCSSDAWGFALDIPALQIGDVTPVVNGTQVTGASIAFQAVRDATYNTVLMVSDLPYLPAP